MLKWIKRLALLLLVLALVAFGTGWWLLRGSVAEIDGELALAGLSAPVTIQRDALGVVTIDAANETDMARALGYVHAQERYFEMDLMRRSSAGELSELFGPIALDLDKEHRVHRMRARVNANLQAFAGDRLPQLHAYTDGVNAGLAALRVKPWPYLLLGQQPRRWEVADSALTGYAMYFDLQDSRNTRELALWKIKAVVPPALYTLLTLDGTEWDAPLFGAPRGNARLPDASALDLARLPMPDSKHLAPLADKGTPGSNNWAIAGALSTDGRAIVADDMHLGLRAPNIWFRARLRYPDARATEGKVDISGFTLPGLPAVVVGSNGHIAWGFTNSYMDTADWARLPLAGLEQQPGYSKHIEKILVAGAPAVDFTVRETAWGPILHEDRDHALALRWVAQLPGAVRVDFADLAVASDLQGAFRVADHAGIPAQNFTVADSSGRIGWQVIGARPDRGPGCVPSGVSEALLAIAPPGPAPATASIPSQSAGCVPWPSQTAHAPRLVDPSSHRLWTANNRTLDADALAVAGDGGYALGARARQIRDGLFARQSFSERDLLAIQLDDRALFLQRWWKLLQDEGSKPGNSALAALATASSQWQGRAATGSVSYRIVRAWRLAVHTRIADGLTAPAQVALGNDFVMPDLPQLEGVAWPLLAERPANLLPRRFASWEALLEDAARQVRDDLAPSGPLDQRRWGERNTAKICHPLANALPAMLKPALCMPADALPGDSAMPRVQGPSFGASERMVVSPGHEADGIIHMPGGQSGNPLSPFWGAGHEDWVQGKPTPFLPGKTEYTLTLKP
ncbi:penicillin acylase family protein [Pseudoxanthomonas gei]|uniref:Penicillin acylase family protein n=1 Tax=Pseudoxanthomonas gei TaxID=1383030 RepID=A0ABX0ADP0_9GAMM|nr:penicillin acylase family protein [Pseudoxanthomonas gei]NDK39707.1 penicillin acylase family protein [Pseudoxanthomonas gei]